MTTISEGSTGDLGAGSSAVIRDAIAFLKGIPPFSSLDEGALIRVTSGIMMDFYPKEHVILYQDEPSPEYFGIAKEYLNLNVDNGCLLMGAYCYWSGILSNPYKAGYFGKLWVMGDYTCGDAWFGFQNSAACLVKEPL